MRCKYSNIFRTQRFIHSFTLIELLVIIAIISLLLAILMPVLRKARMMGKRVACQSNLKQIALAWHVFLNDHDGSFLQGVNINHDFGGWKGNGGYALFRPLNEYLNLPPEIKTKKGAKAFKCPADRGGIFGLPPQELAYHYFGNSYQTNIFLIGPNQVGLPRDNRVKLHFEINKRLKNLNITAISNPSSHLLLVGDNNWLTQWEFLMPRGRDWHGRCCYYNMAFLDCHVEFIEIRKGFYVAPDYHVQPFKELNSLARELQEEVPCEE